MAATSRERRMIRLVLLTAMVLAAIVLGFFLFAYLTFERGPDDVDRQVSAAINAPGGGDYDRAVAIVRGSTLPDDLRTLQIGQLVVDSFGSAGAHRPTETLQDGLHRIEQVATSHGEARKPAQRQLRAYFERGIGTQPNRIPIDRVTATCWERIETGIGDPARCIALRRLRLPHLSAEAAG